MWIQDVSASRSYSLSQCSTWLCCHHPASCWEYYSSTDWQRRGDNLSHPPPSPLSLSHSLTHSLGLTQAERGFLHIFCHTIWGLVSVAALLRTHLAAHSADRHLLLPTSWWMEETTTKQTLLSCSLPWWSAYSYKQCLQRRELITSIHPSIHLNRWYLNHLAYINNVGDGQVHKQVHTIVELLCKS